MKQTMAKLEPMIEFVNSFDAPENLKTMLDFLKSDYTGDYPNEKLRPLKVEFSPYISKKIQEVAKTMGISEKEALKQLVEDNLETLEKAEEKFNRLQQPSRKTRKS